MNLDIIEYPSFSLRQVAVEWLAQHFPYSLREQVLQCLNISTIFQ
ncbi:hypothetical protein [Moorena bouillonii]|nr:hypothetical protein [Moorena bouillonii]